MVCSRAIRPAKPRWFVDFPLDTDRICRLYNSGFRFLFVRPVDRVFD